MLYDIQIIYEDESSFYFWLPHLSVATAVVATVDTTAVTMVEEVPVAAASPVAKGTSPLAVHVAMTSVANGRLPAAVPLTVRFSAACDMRALFLR